MRCSAIGVALGATPMQNVLLIEGLLVVALRAATSAFRGDIPARRMVHVAPAR